MMDILMNCSISLTPPLSPAESEQEDESDEEDFPIACFHCLGEVKQKEESFHIHSYLKSHHFDNLLINMSVRYGPVQQRTRIFNNDWSTSLTEEDIETLFLMMRQKIVSIQSHATNRTDRFRNNDMAAERAQINRSLEFVLIQVRNAQFENSELPMIVLKEVHALIMDVGRISELQHLHSGVALERNSVGHCYFHLHLDVYWRLLCILHLLQKNYPDSVYSSTVSEVQMDEVTPVYDQLLHIILWDLVTISQIRYLNVVKGHEYRKVNLFSCICVQELWLLCIKLSQLRSSQISGEFFWLSLHHIIKTILDWKSREKEIILEREDCCVITNPPEVFKVEDSTSLCLWLISNIAPLYRDSCYGEDEQTDKYVSNYHDLQSILKKFMTSPPISESSLKRHLHACLYITTYWEPNTKLLIELWEYFYRRLNDTFHDGTSIVDGLACVDKTIAGFYSRCKRWTSGYEENINSDTSFQMFLRILTQHFGQLHTGNNQDWKKFKGRIYSKFSPQRIQDLTEGGLYNLTCLFLTLAMTTNLEDVASKLCDFYDMLDFEHITYGKRSVIWRGAFTLMLIYQERNMDISFLADKMTNTLEHSVSDFKDADTATKHNIWELVIIYLEGTTELIDSSRTLSRSEYKLIGPAIGTLLPLCSTNQLRHILSVIQTIINKFRQVLEMRDKDQPALPLEEEQNKDMADRLWRHGYNFIVDHSQTLTPGVEIADIASEFCLLSLQFPPPYPSKDTFLTVFQTFAGGEKTNSSVSCRFLGHMLTHREVTARLQSELGNWEPIVIRCWFKCCVLIPSPSVLLEEVTRTVLQLNEVKGIFEQASMEVPSTPLYTPVQFVKALHKGLGKIEESLLYTSSLPLMECVGLDQSEQADLGQYIMSWQEKMQFQQRVIPYFTDLHKWVIPVLRNQGPLNVLSNVYYIVGNMMKYCAKIVYVRQDIIVPSILSSMILPTHVMDKDKPLNQALMSAIKETLHLFIQGLGRLAYERDLFVQRRLKDIVVAYLPKFAINCSMGEKVNIILQTCLNKRTSSVSSGLNSVAAVHPVVASLGGSFIQQPSQEAIKFRHYLMQVVIDNFLVVKNMAVHPHHSMGWSFLCDVTHKTSSSVVRARDFPVILLICLEYLVLLPDQSSVLPHIAAVLQQTGTAHASHPDVNPMSKVLATCQGFVKVYSRYNMTAMLKVIEKLALVHKPAVMSVISDLSISVQEMENKRGVGSDQVIRKKYFTILQGLGKRGQEELLRLKSYT